MVIVDSSEDGSARGHDAEEIRRVLDRARHAYHEDPAAAIAEGVRCYEVASALESPALLARALGLQGFAALHCGDLQGALSLALDAECLAAEIDDVHTLVEVTALHAQLAYMSGAYADALTHAAEAVEMADVSEDQGLRMFAWRATCLVLANLDIGDWRGRLHDAIAYAVEAGDRWQEAVSRNDLACHLADTGDTDGAARELRRAFDAAHDVPGANRFVLGILHSTRADVGLRAGSAHEALRDAQQALALLRDCAEPNPYVVGVTVRAEIEAHMAVGQVDEAQHAAAEALRWMGDRVPHIRSAILSTLAVALRAAGRPDAAYEALESAAELEHAAFRELSELRLAYERAAAQARLARSESDALAAKNRELATAHAELERRAAELEGLHTQLREQAERDPLTGLYNRRFLTGEIARLARDRRAGPLSVAVLDLDHFKDINDRFGHDTGDEVLIRIAHLLSDVLRAGDTVVRTGGEEFVILMPQTDVEAAAVCCERVCQAIRGADWAGVADGLLVTTCAGVASAADAAAAQELLRLADARLYEAKGAGRDRVIGEQPAR